MPRSFVSCDDVSHEGETNTWFTPKWLIDDLGPFDLDPCTQTFRPHDTANRHICEDAGGDGFAEEWKGRVWLNPPYGREIGKWLSKLQEHGNGVALVFGRTETKWGQRCIESADAVNFIRGRLSFVRHDGSESSNAGTGSMLLAYGSENVSRIFNVPGIIFVGGVAA